MNSEKQNPGVPLGFVNPERNLCINMTVDDNESCELNEIKPTINNGIQHDVNIEIMPKNDNDILPWIMKIERSNNVKEFKVKNCISTSFIMKFFESSDIEDELMDLKTILSVKFEFNSNFIDLETSELEELSRKCRHKAVLIQLVSKSDERISIFWKSKEIHQFLTVKKISNIELDEYKYFHEYVAEFLLESLKSGQSGLISTFALKPETTEIEVNFLGDPRDYNLLLQACAKDDAKIVKTACALGMNTTLQGTKISAQSLAMQNGHYDVILVLIEANLPFPKSFDIKKSPEEFRAVYKTTELLHEYIRNNETEKVKKIVLENPQKCYFYNIHNESALTVALLNESMETYELLLSQKLRFGPYEDSDALLQGLSESNKRVAREIHNRHTQDSPMKHINVVLSNSFICHDVDHPEEKMKYINRAYRALNENIFISMLLMIVAASKKFKIIFDFNRDCVSGADPTVDANTQGLIYLSGRIYVGAKQLLNNATEHETLATMAHELCHYVMNLVFKNDAKPYTSNDHQTMQDFEKVSEKCQKLLGAEEVVDLVYECYPPESFHPELIVRVVHLLALYRNQPEKLKEVSETYSDLFEFYEKRIHPQLEDALPVIAEKAEKENEEKDDLIFKYKFFLIVGGILCLILFIAGFFVVRAVFYKPTYVFGELSNDDKLRVREAPINYKNVELKFLDLFPESSMAYDNLTSANIARMLDKEPLDFGDLHLDYLNKYISHDWKNLAGKLKQKVLSSNFRFQNDIIKLRLLHEKMPNVFESLSSNQIIDTLDGKELIIGKKVINHINFYMERKFFDEDIVIAYYAYTMELDYHLTNNSFSDYLSDLLNNYDKWFNGKVSQLKQNNEIHFILSNYGDIVNSMKEIQFSFDDVYEKSQDQKFFILSSEVGAGKTTSFQQFALRIKNKFPKRWVSFIDLKEFTNFYNKSGVLEMPSKLFETILGYDEVNLFENKIIEEYLKTKDVALFWDGFDEISPDYNKFVMHVLEYLYNNTNITQFVSTRPFYSEQLRNQFGVRAYTFVPLNKEEQTDFLAQALHSKNVSNEKVSKYIDKIENVFRSLKSEDASEDYKFDSPGILVMFATVISNNLKIFDDKNLYQIYENLVKIKIDEWQETELGLKFIKSISYSNKLTLHEVFMKYSLIIYRFLIPKHPRIKLVGQKIPELFTNTEISRSGILYLNGRFFDFFHGTVGDFLLAQYILTFIFDEDEIGIFPVEYEIFVDVMKITMSESRIIIRFLNSYIKTQPQHKKLNLGLVEHIRANQNKFLFGLFGEEKFEVFWVIFKIFSKQRDLLVESLHVNGDETLYTALFNPIYYASSLSPNVAHSEVKELVEEFLMDENELEKFINGKNQRGLILFNQFYWEKVKGITISHDNFILDEKILKSKKLSIFFDKVVKDLNEPEIDTLFLSHTSSIYNYSVGLLQKNDPDYEIIENYLIDNGKYKEFLLNMIEVTMKSLKFTNDSNFQLSLPEKATKTIMWVVYDLFLNKGLMNFVPNEQNFEFFWNFLANFTTHKQQVELLRHKTSGICIKYYIPLENCTATPPFNAFHSIFFEEIFDENHFGLKLYEEYFNKTEIQQMILESNEFLIYMVYDKVGSILQDCLNYLRKLFDGDENLLRGYLTSKIKSINMSILDYFKNFNIFSINLLIIDNLLNELSVNDSYFSN